MLDSENNWQEQENLSKRKQTLIQLLDVLRELQDDDLNLPQPKGTAPFGVKNEEPNADEHIQKEGSLPFTKFQRRVQNLDRELQTFSNAIRTLASSTGLLSSSFHLRQRLTRILFLVRKNAVKLFPRKIRHENDPAANIHQRSYHVQDRMWHDAPPDVAPPHLEKDEFVSEFESFPAEIEGLAQDIYNFLNCLNEFPEFCDENMNASLMTFEHNLKYWASCLREFEGQFRSIGVARYVHDLSGEIGEYLPAITSALVEFTKIGVPTVKLSQDRGSSSLMNLSIIAILFSVVTATTIQLSFNRIETRLDNIVNVLWYSSLVFSTTSAVNSCFAVTWRQAMYRSPGHRVPWFVVIWIKQSPLVFLASSVAAFFVGLCIFTWASGQPTWLCIIVTVFTSCSSLCLIVFSGWFLLERSVYQLYRGTAWADEVIAERFKKIKKAIGMGWVRAVPPKRVEMAAAAVLEDGTHPERTSTSRASFILQMHSPVPAEAPSPAPLRSNVAFGPPLDHSPSPLLGHSTHPNSLSSPTAEVQAITSSESRPSKSVAILSLPSAGRLARMKEARGALNQIGVSLVIPVHQALVSNIAFSPNGTHLATCSWDRTSAIMTMADLSSHRIIAHPQDLASQVMWSPDGSLLLTKLTSGITIWTTEGVCKARIDRHTAVHGVAWFTPGGEFLSIETNEVVHLDIQGRVIDRYPFERLQPHYIAITKDSKRLIAVATLEQSRDGYALMKARSEKRIMVYNRLRKVIEHQVPVLHDICDIKISQNDRFVLVTYENKVPQLWRIDMVQDDSRLVLAQTYVVNQEADFSGSGSFGGKDDQMVLYASKRGGVHVWDRESGTLLHHYPRQMYEGDITCIAWNGAAEEHVFSTGTHDGTVRLWQAPDVTRGPSAVGTCDIDGGRRSHALEDGALRTHKVMMDDLETLEKPLGSDRYRAET